MRIGGAGTAGKEHFPLKEKTAGDKMTQRMSLFVTSKSSMTAHAGTLAESNPVTSLGEG